MGYGIDAETVPALADIFPDRAPCFRLLTGVSGVVKARHFGNVAEIGGQEAMVAA